ncbi:hypothetical protein LCGC14_2773020, partial [marine sediment metagenome]
MDNKNWDDNVLTPEEKDYLINQALSSEDGRLALASSMANPIRFELDYYAVGRKLLVVDPLPQGVYPIYDKDIKIPAYVVGKRGQAPDRIVEGERVTIPTWELVAYPQARFSQIKARRFNLVDRIQTRARLDLAAIEDQNIFNTLNAAGASGINPVTTVANTLTKGTIITAMGEVGKWDLRPFKMLMNYSEYVDLLRFGQNDLDLIHQHEIIETGLLGRYMGLEILVSKMVTRGAVKVLAEPEYVGVMPIRQDINVIPADKPEKLRIGFVVYEEIGMSVINPRSVANIN